MRAFLDRNGKVYAADSPNMPSDTELGVGAQGLSPDFIAILPTDPAAAILQSEAQTLFIARKEQNGTL